MIIITAMFPPYSVIRVMVHVSTRTHMHTHMPSTRSRRWCRKQLRISTPQVRGQCGQDSGWGTCPAQESQVTSAAASPAEEASTCSARIPATNDPQTWRVRVSGRGTCSVERSESRTGLAHNFLTTFPHWRRWSNVAATQWPGRVFSWCPWGRWQDPSPRDTSPCIAGAKAAR